MEYFKPILIVIMICIEACLAIALVVHVKTSPKESDDYTIKTACVSAIALPLAVMLLMWIF